MWQVWRLWCRLVGHKWGAWEQPWLFIPSRRKFLASRACVRCAWVQTRSFSEAAYMEADPRPTLIVSEMLGQLLTRTDFTPREFVRSVEKAAEEIFA